MKKTALVPLFFLLCGFLVLCARGTNNIEVGAYFYTWYNEGWESSHWNDTISNNVVDEPLLRYYSSNNTETIKTQLTWVEETGIDFLIHSWWGINDFTDNSSQKVFNVTRDYNYTLKHCILIEPFNGTYPYNWTYVYNYIEATFITQYTFYYKLYNKPLILILEQCFVGWNDNPVNDNSHYNYTRDGRFTIRVVGSHQVSDWFYGDVESRIRDDGDFSYRINRDGSFNVFPRFDEYYLERSNPARIDYDLSLRYNQEQWNLAYDYVKANRVKMVLITSWNEYHERHMIEPHKDVTAYNAFDNDYFLQEETKAWITRIRNISTEVWRENWRPMRWRALLKRSYSI